MHLKEIHYKLIGVIHSPFKDPKGTPIQPIGARGIRGTVDVYPEYGAGLKDLGGFSHVILIYHFHQISEQHALQVKPFLDNMPRGIFATRAPGRPNPIGISVVRLDKIEGTRLYISNVDILDGTPLLDIKPYVPDFDREEAIRIGWLTNKTHQAASKKSDDRFLTRSPG